MQTIARVYSEDAKAFIRAAVRSVWALELLLFLRAHVGQTWDVKALTRELRAAEPLIQEMIGIFRAVGVIGGEEIRYAPATEQIDGIVCEIADEYTRRPISAIKEIYALETSKIQDFANAFRIKKKD
jgi:hypothetical protein